MRFLGYSAVSIAAVSLSGCYIVPASGPIDIQQSPQTVPFAPYNVNNDSNRPLHGPMVKNVQTPSSKNVSPTPQPVQPTPQPVQQPSSQPVNHSSDNVAPAPSKDDDKPKSKPMDSTSQSVSPPAKSMTGFAK
jgi:hypothetical protein